MEAGHAADGTDCAAFLIYGLWCVAEYEHRYSSALSAWKGTGAATGRAMIMARPVASLVAILGLTNGRP